MVRLRPRVLWGETVRDADDGRAVEVCEGAGGGAHLETIAHEEATTEDEDDQRTAGLGRRLGSMDADFALVTIAHGDCARLLVAAGGDGFVGSLLFDCEAPLT